MVICFLTSMYQFLDNRTLLKNDFKCHAMKQIIQFHYQDYFLRKKDEYYLSATCFLKNEYLSDYCRQGRRRNNLTYVICCIVSSEFSYINLYDEIKKGLKVLPLQIFFPIPRALRSRSYALSYKHHDP